VSQEESFWFVVVNCNPFCDVAVKTNLLSERAVEEGGGGTTQRFPWHDKALSTEHLTSANLKTFSASYTLL